VIVKYLTEVFQGNTRAWKEHFPEALQLKFCVDLTQLLPSDQQLHHPTATNRSMIERELKHDVASALVEVVVRDKGLVLLLSRLEDLVSFRLYRGSLLYMLDDDKLLGPHHKFEVLDIEHFGPRIKHMNVVQYAKVLATRSNDKLPTTEPKAIYRASRYVYRRATSKERLGRSSFVWRSRTSRKRWIACPSILRFAD
jgi:hypothetical protein